MDHEQLAIVAVAVLIGFVSMLGALIALLCSDRKFTFFVAMSRRSANEEGPARPLLFRLSRVPV